MLYLKTDTLPILRDSGIRKFQKGEVHVTRTLEFSVLILVFEGVLELEENGKHIKIPAGSYHIQLPNQLHKGLPISHPPYYQYIHFWGEYSNEKAEDYLPIDGVFEINEIKKLTFIADANENNIHSVFETKNFCDILIKLVKFYQTKSSKQAYKIAYFIEQNIHNNINLEILHKQFFYSENYIIRIFKETFSTTPHNYIIQKRIDNAKNLLINTENNLDKIAEEVGFADATVLFKHFKSITGYSPGNYRKTFSKQ